MDEKRRKQLDRRLAGATVGLAETRKILKAYIEFGEFRAFLSHLKVAAVVLAECGYVDESYKLCLLYDEFKWGI